MNCKAVPLQSPVSHCAHWVEMGKKNEPQRGSTNNFQNALGLIHCGTPLGFNHRAVGTQRALGDAGLWSLTPLA